MVRRKIDYVISYLFFLNDENVNDEKENKLEPCAGPSNQSMLTKKGKTSSHHRNKIIFNKNKGENHISLPSS